MAQKRILPHNIRVDRNCQPIRTPQNAIPDVQELISLGGGPLWPPPPCKGGLKTKNSKIHVWMQELYLYCICNTVLKLNMLSLFFPMTMQYIFISLFEIRTIELMQSCPNKWFRGLRRKFSESFMKHVQISAVLY